MISSHVRTLLPVLALLALGACSGSGGSDAPDPEPSAQPSAPASDDGPTADVDETAACKLLTSAERKKLTGLAVDTVISSDARAGSSQCRWQESAALVQITTLHAQDWAKTLPAVVKELESSTDVSSAKDERDLAKAKKLLDGAGSFTGSEACRAFRTLAEINGGEKGATTAITPVPITETETGISAQTCTTGELTSIVYSVPDLQETETIDRTVTAVLRSAQERVVAAR